MSAELIVHLAEPYKLTSDAFDRILLDAPCSSASFVIA